MADINADIEITATDEASGEIEDVGKKTNKALKAVKKFGQMGATAFKAFTVAAVGINQGLEVLKKFKEVASAAIEKSLAFRKANDPLVKSFGEISDTVGGRFTKRLRCPRQSIRANYRASAGFLGSKSADLGNRLGRVLSEDGHLHHQGCRRGLQSCSRNVHQVSAGADRGNSGLLVFCLPLF